MTSRCAMLGGAFLVFSFAAIALAAQTVTSKESAPAATAATPASAETVELDPITVEAAREADDAAAALHEQNTAPNITSVASTAEFGRLPDSNPGEFLKFLPGIDIEQIAPGYRRFGMHGLGPEYMELLFDGLPLANVHGERTSRRFDVSLVSAADVAFAEVRKLPLPSDSANSLGGTINLAPRSALNTHRRRITYLASLRSDAETLTTGSMQVPGGPGMDRWRPSWQFSWTEPVRPDFGFSITCGQDDLLLHQRFSSPGWSLGSAKTNADAEAALAAGGEVPAEVSIFNPALASAIVFDAPQLQKKTYASAYLDWRPRPELKIHAGLGRHDSLQRDMQTRYQWTIAPFTATSGVLTRGHDATHTLGPVRTGSARHNGQTWRDQSHLTSSAVLAATWTRDAWELSATTGWSKADFAFTDTGGGNFGGTTVAGVSGLRDIPATGVGLGTANPLSLMLDFHHTAPGLSQVDAWTIRTGVDPAAAIAADYTVPVSWQSNDVARIGGARSRPGHAEETVTSAKVFAKRKLASASPTTVQLGLDWSGRARERRIDYHAWRFIGADGLANSADDSAALIGGGHDSARRDPVYGYPMPESISMARLYQLYQENPAWFRYDAARSERLTLTTDSAYDLKETIAAPYLEFQTKPRQGRLRLTGGVRYERIEARARGLLVDNSASYLRYADGSVVHAGDIQTDPAGLDHRLVLNLGTPTAVNYVLVYGPALLPTTRTGAPVFSAEIQAAGNAARAADESTDINTNLGRGTLAHTRAVYREKGATNNAANDGWFPSLHASYDISERVLLQAGYARTQGRLDYVTALIPNNQVSDDLVVDGNGAGAIGQITLQNPNLQPWTADSFEARLAWSFDRGLVAFSAFRKNVRNFQPEVVTPPLSASELENYAQLFPDAGLGPEYEGYSLRYRSNAGSACLDGAEIELRTSLDAWLPEWSRGLQLTGTATYLNRSGPNGDELGLNRAWMGSANLRYVAGRFAVQIGYRFNGEQVVNAQLDSNGRSGRAIREAQHLVDATCEYTISRGVRLFITGTNLTHALTTDEQRFPEKPAYANISFSHNTGAMCAIGINGTF